MLYKKIIEVVEDVINKDNVGYDTIIVDPPRSGVDKKAIGVLNNSETDTIIYVSCDPILSYLIIML